MKGNSPQSHLNMSMRQMKVTDQDPEDEDVVFKDLPPHKQRLYNEMVQFKLNSMNKVSQAA